MARQEKKITPVISVINMKGGVGKTTISAHLFREFYLHTAKSVLIIDFDPQFNLTQTLYSEAVYEKLKSHNRTVLSVMESPEDNSLYSTHKKIGAVPEPGEVAVNAKYFFDKQRDDKKVTLDIVPGDFSLCKFSLMDDREVLNTAAKRFSSFIEKAREVYDLICIDCNPSSSFLTTCALKSSTHLLIPVRPDRYSMLGLRMLDNFVDSFKGLTVKPKKIIILNGIPTSQYDPVVENELRADPIYGRLTLTTSLYATKLLEASPRHTGFATDRKVAYSKSLKRRMRSLATELAEALGLK
ncbi:ParA family protein [Pseudomonas aeruginosa]|uniref:ParA family protein n=1 Tax=Pseudomonas aeruginosa TaxID=287 RepID=UPI000F527F3E|nr:ParA family protein [Pseudomonas aeruginosa]RPW53601.1 hypothetical protein IPC740_19500 [Pseudomonas aeruginosa]HBP4953674.1 ParA family protein [Pseudomonas aeruginosa]HBP5778930.1 ParA family protein [Pseudomonas aeruginosa]